MRFAASTRTKRVLNWARPRVPLLAGLTLGGLIVLSFALRAGGAGLTDAPQILCDEFVHAEVARGVWEEQRFAIRGSPVTPNSAIYPILIAPAFSASGMLATFTVIKLINALLASLVAVPVFFWTRRIVGPLWALLAAALALTLPGLAYAGLVMTESAFLPAFVAACWGIALAIERPTLARQAGALALIAVATGIRVQGLLLVGVLITAVVIAALLGIQAEPGPPRLRNAGNAITRWWPAAAVLGVALVAVLLVRAGRGGGVEGVLGPYSAIAEGRYTVSGVWRHVRFHLAALPLSVALVPASAFLVLLARAVVPRNATTLAERAFLATTTAAIPWFIISTAAFASFFTTGRLVERYTFYLGPLLLMSLVVWLGRGLPRPRVVTLVMAAVPLLLLLEVPFRSLLAPDSTINAFSFVPYWLLVATTSLDVDAVVALIAVVGIALAAVFALAPRRVAVVAIPVAVAGLLVYSSVKVSDNLQVQATFARVAPSVGEEPAWIDAELGSETTTRFLFTGPPNGSGSLETRTVILMAAEFWNRSVRGVDLVDEQVCGLQGGRHDIDPRTGELTPRPGSAPSDRPPTHAVTFNEIRLVGDVVVERPPLTLARLDGPLRIASVIEGRTDDGWMGSESQLAVMTTPGGDRRSRVKIELARPALSEKVLPTANATATVGPLIVGPDGGWGHASVTSRQTFRVGSGVTIATVSAPKPPYLVTVELDRTFVPAEVEIGEDARELGAQVEFRVSKP